MKEARYPKLRNLVLFFVWESVRAWAHWYHCFHKHLSYLGQCPVLFISWAPLGLTIGSGCSLMAARWQVFFSFLCALRAHQLLLRVQSLMTVTSLFTHMAYKTPFLSFWRQPWGKVCSSWSFFWLVGGEVTWWCLGYLSHQLSDSSQSGV